MAVLLSYALTDLPSVKESLGIASSDTSWDNLITRKINQATLAIERYTGRHFALTTYTAEEYNTTNTNQIILKQRPVTSLSTLGNRDTSLNEGNFDTVDTNLYFLDTNSGVLDLNFTTFGSWNRWSVTYTAGYATIPEDLAEACASLAAYYVNTADGSNIGVSQKQEGQRSVRYGTNSLKDLSFEAIIRNLGIDEILATYSNYPLLADK